MRNESGAGILAAPFGFGHKYFAWPLDTLARFCGDKQAGLGMGPAFPGSLEQHLGHSNHRLHVIPRQQIFDYVAIGLVRQQTFGNYYSEPPSLFEQ